MKRKKMISTSVLIKFLTSVFLLIILIGTLLGNTDASFNDVETVFTNISAGTWEPTWDKSSLQFANENQAKELSCTEQITVTLSNVSENDLVNPVSYFVQYSNTSEVNNGNNPGDQLFEGTLTFIPANGVISLTYSNADGLSPGYYKFKVENHKYKTTGNGVNYPLSESIQVTCNPINSTSVPAEGQDGVNDTQMNSESSQNENTEATNQEQEDKTKKDNISEDEEENSSDATADDSDENPNQDTGTPEEDNNQSEKNNENSNVTDDSKDKNESSEEQRSKKDHPQNGEKDGE